MAIPSMLNLDLGLDERAFVNPNRPLSEEAKAEIIEESARQREEWQARQDGSPGGILRDPWVQRGLALIVGAFVGGGVAYLVFGRKRGE